MQAVHFKALNLLNIVGNPLVIEACTRGVSTAASSNKRSKSRGGKTKARIVMSIHGNLELS